MELVTCIAGKIVDYSVEPIKRQVDYVIDSKSNLKKLEIELKDLRDARRTIEERIAEATSKGGRILEEVENWVKEVDEVTGKANQLKDESQAANLNCVNGCSLNLRMRRQLSKQSIELVDKIARLIRKKVDFPEIARGCHREEVAGIPTGDYMPFDSRESAVEQIMDELKNPNTVRIRVCGIGGVGKTTLVKEVFRKAKQDTSLFDKVAILFDVKSIPDLEGIQKEIVEKLGMDLEKGETMVNRARRLCGYINKGKKILIILDDVQTKIDLEKLGVPGVATCKILLTSRIPIYGMSTDKGFKLGILAEEEALELFANKAGVLDKVPAIQRVAKDVAKKCGGLPVLVVTVASSLKDKNILHLWEDALRCLKEFDHKESPEQQAHSTIEWSYNQLRDSMLKDLFLLCGTTGRGNRIRLEDLFKYNMGLSEFKNNHTVEQTRNAFYSKVEKLKDFCLLIDGEDNTSVRMHDIVRDAARHIALRDHHMLSAVEDGGDDQSDGKGWPNKELTEKCTTISFPSAHNIPEVLQCPALKMLLLEGDNRDVSLKILPGFFEEMKQLRVLSLGHMRLPSLPSSLQFLNNLQTLCLHKCELEVDISLVGQLNNLEILSLEKSSVEQLPKEIGQLTRLRLLDLSNCQKLSKVSPGVISSLKRLEDLRMRESFTNWKAAGDGSNASLFELKHLSQLTALEVRVPDANILPADFLSHELKRFQIMIGNEWYLWDYKDDRTLNKLKLELTVSSIELDRDIKKLLKICDDLSLDGTESVNRIVRQLDSRDCPQVRHLCVQNNVDFEYIRNKDVFPNLTILTVHKCDHLTFLLSFSMAKSLSELKHLEISYCEIMEAIVECGQENMDNMFSKLEDLTLSMLPNLTKFCSDPGMLVSRWPSLKILHVRDCGKVESFAGELPFFQEKHELNPQTQQSLFLIDESSFLNLEDLELHRMDIWSGPPPAKLVFGKLKYIKFCDLSSIPHHVKLFDLFPNLEIIEVRGSCCKQIFVNEGNTSCGEIHAVGSGTLLHVRDLSLFTSDVLHLGNSQSAATAGPLFPNLQILYVERCYRLKNLDSSTISFQNLTTLTVFDCWGLKYLTSYSVAKSLVQLTKLEVSRCHKIVAIVQVSNIVRDDDDAAANEIAFSRLQHLKLYDLPSLQGFCSSENCIVKFPPSVNLDVEVCAVKLTRSPDGVLLTDELYQDEDEEEDDEDEDDEDEDEEDDDDEQNGVDDDEQNGFDDDYDNEQKTDVR